MRWLLLSICLFASAAHADSVIVQIASPEATGTTTKVSQDELIALVGTGKPGVYTFLIITPTSSGIALRECSVTVTDKAGTGGTTPTNPPVNPPTFTSRYGLEKLVREWLKNVPAESAKDAKRLSLAYATTIVQLEKGRIQSVEELQNHQRETNKILLGDSSTAWIPWGTALGTELQRLKTAGSLETLDDHKQAWMEIARGLNGE